MLLCFSTGKGGDPDAINELDSLIDSNSIANLLLVRQNEVETGDYLEKLDSFLSNIKIILNGAQLFRVQSDLVSLLLQVLYNKNNLIFLDSSGV